MGITPEQAEFVNEFITNKISSFLTKEKISQGDIFKLTRECYSTIVERGIDVPLNFQIELYKDVIKTVEEYHGKKEEKRRAS